MNSTQNFEQNLEKWVVLKKKIMEINTINLVGRAGREPDVRYFESGSIVANFTLAVNRRSRDE